MMKNEIRIWDPLVRIFHWSLVTGFSIAYLTGEVEGNLHIYSGYIVLGLISFRVVWGFIGTRHARFSDFIYSRESVSRYLKSLLTGKPKHYTGHNPAGGWMVIAMLVSLFVVSISGLKLYAVEEGLGPLAGPVPAVTIISTAYADDDDDGKDKKGEEFWEEIHEASANFMLFLVFLHIAGVIVSGFLHGENLVKAMLTGKKTCEADSKLKG